MNIKKELLRKKKSPPSAGTQNSSNNISVRCRQLQGVVGIHHSTGYTE